MSTRTSSTDYDIHNTPIVVGYRTVIFLLGLADILYANIFYGPINTEKYFTYQSNIFIVAWLFLALIWRANPGKLQKICGSLRGAITVYISVTFIVYGIILAPLSHPTGAEIYLNIIHHYLDPAVFIFDFFYTERTTYKAWNLLYWFIYPHIYLEFAFIWGTFIQKGDFIYEFLDYTKLGAFGYFRWYLILLILVLVLTYIYYSFPRYMEKKAKTSS